MSDIVIRKKSMTLETSFYGYRNISNKHFEVKDLHRIGNALAETIFTQQSRDPKTFNWDMIKSDIKEAVAIIRREKAKKDKENES